MNSHFNKEIIELIYRAIKPDLVLLFVRDNDNLNLVATIGSDGLVSHENTPQHKIDECLCGIATRHGKPLYSMDILSDPSCTWHECKKSGMRSFAALPLLHDNHVIGILGLGSISPRDFSEHANILEPLAAAITISLKNNILLEEHEKTEEALRQSESRFRQLFERMNEGVALHRIVLNPDGSAKDYVIEDVNNSYEKTLGISRYKVLGELATQAYGTDQAPYLKEFSTVVSTGKPIDFETYFEPMQKQFSISVIPWDKDGFATIFFDITARKKSEDASHKALAFLETLLKSSPMGIRVFEGDSGNCVLVNQAAADIAGGSIDEMLRQNFKKLFSWRHAGITEVAEKVLTDGIARPIETELFTTFDKHVAARYFLSRFSVENKPHLMVIGRDATEEKRLEDQKKQIESQMLHVQKLESLGVLAGGIAHDFNNILMAIIGNADLALMTMTSSQSSSNYIHEIKHAARRAADLAHQMLAYSGKGHFIIEPLDINKAICEITALLDVSVSKKASLNLELTDDLPLVKADSTQLCQIIMNLVINASEAIEDNNGNINIQTGVVDCNRSFFSKAWIDDKLPEGQYVFVQVTDTGCGMDKDTQSKLFEPFFTTKFTGRGLGMSAVLGIIRGHKGTITVHSEPGKGSTFTVYLPAADCSENSPLTQAVSEQSCLNMTGTILLVDDEEIIRHMVSTMLEMFGFKVVMASDGIEAIERYKENAAEIVCVLLDLTMPRMDGEQTFLQLRQMSPDLPIIISSGFGEQDIADKFIEKGLAYFIQKPYQMNKLEQKINDVLGITIPRP
jgi:two-component system, cell cycle sensor histidine kinase and response regulator CckA